MSGKIKGLSVVLLSVATFSFFLLTNVRLSWTAGTVPTDVKLTGTQQGEVPSFTSPDNCDNCHGGYNAAVEPAFLWRGGMMANATRDSLFWATLAVAEQDFLPGSDPAARGGVGDMCIRCHSVNGWISNRSTPTDGSGLSANADVNGVECEFCHLMVDPDPPITIAGTTEVQNHPFEAYDPLPHPPGETYRGAAQYVLNGNGTRLGPFTDANAKHAFLPSPMHRQAELCATCHDVSNPAVGDLAPNNGAMLPLVAGTYSGTPGTPVDGKAAFNNAPYKYGIVERTYSEWKSSVFPTLLVNDFNTLPADLKVTGGALQVAYARAYTARSNANYEDGAVRYYTCQTCHMSATTGVGCNKPGTPTRTDLPTHDQTGGQYWMPDVVQYMNTKGTLRLGGNLNQIQIDALTAGKTRGQQMLQSAARLSAGQVGPNLVVRVTNLTAHKLISGYPEGRRMWINVRWYDAGNNLVAENGAYGSIGRTAPDLNNVQHDVQSILDPSSTQVYEAQMGLDQAWAAKLITVGYDPSLTVSYDRLSDAPEHTLGELATSPPGTIFHSFHFVLNNTVQHDDRIPPYGFQYDTALARSSLPVPASQFGDPGPGGTYNYWDDVPFLIPATATSAQVRLYYQQTSWEYIQFLWKQNDQLSPFLGNEGINMLDAWLNTGESPPFQIHMVTVGGLVPPVLQPPGEASHQEVRAEHMWVAKNGDQMEIHYTPACGSTGHTVYYGDAFQVSAYAYSGADCSADTSGVFLMPMPADSVFFVIVGNNGSEEGSYGHSSDNTERPEAGSVDGCGYPQNLVGTCDPAWIRRASREPALVPRAVFAPRLCDMDSSASCIINY
jgi:hypothetical protein